MSRSLILAGAIALAFGFVPAHAGVAGQTPAPRVKPPLADTRMIAPVEIVVRNVNPHDAEARLAVYDTAETFLVLPKVKMRARAVDGVAVFLLRGLEPGNYSLAVYVDQNGNGELDRGALGRPKEPVVFSEGVVPKLRKPTFEETQVKLTEGARIDIAFAG